MAGDFAGVRDVNRVRLASLYALRAQVDALIVAEETDFGIPPELSPLPVDPARTCPNCGSEGESQIDRSTLDGTKRILCTGCHRERVLERVS